MVASWKDPASRSSGGVTGLSNRSRFRSHRFWNREQPELLEQRGIVGVQPTVDCFTVSKLNHIAAVRIDFLVRRRYAHECARVRAGHVRAGDHEITTSDDLLDFNTEIGDAFEVGF